MVHVVEADPLTCAADLLVHPWNRNCLGVRWFDHKGITGEIRLRAGEEPFRELARRGRLPLGGAVLTTAGKLPFEGIVHVAVRGDLWSASERSIRASLLGALALATDHGHRSVATPVLGAGHGVAPERALELVLEVLEGSGTTLEVTVAKLPAAMRRHLKKPYRVSWPEAGGT